MFIPTDQPSLRAKDPDMAYTTAQEIPTTLAVGYPVATATVLNSKESLLRYFKEAVKVLDQVKAKTSLFILILSMQLMP